MKDYYHILITRKKIDSEYKKYNICSLKEVEGYYKNYIIGKTLIIDSDEIKHCDISSFTVMKSSKKIENKNINFNTDDDIKNCTEEIKSNIELNISETLLKFYCENKWFAWIIIFLILLTIVNIIWPFLYIGDIANEKKYEFFGIIGDSSGLLGTILSGLAFLLLIYTATLQKNELSLQRKELEDTRTELKNQKKEFQIQNQTLKRQQFENTFFNMLKTQENIVSGLALSSSTTTTSTTDEEVNYCISKITGVPLPSSTTSTTVEVKGRKVFENLYYILKKALDSLFLNPHFTKENVISEYASCTKLKMLDHYFRHMYRIVKFVKQTDFSFCLADEEDKNKTEEEKQNKMKDEKYQYTSILRATLSPYELALLFYNCLNKEENNSRKNKFNPLIEEYCLLQNIRSEFLKKETLGYYKNEAYGNRYEDIKKELEKNN